MSNKKPQRHTSRKHKGKNSNNMGLFVAGVLVIGFLAMRFMGSIEHSARDALPDQEREILLIEQTEAESGPTSEAKEQRERAGREVLQRRQSLALHGDLGLQSISIANADPVTISVNIKTRPQWCQVGDVDIMREALKEIRNSRLIMTLEGMGGERRLRPQVRAIREAELRSGFSHVFQVPASRVAGGLGLFICLDSNRQNSCQNKHDYSIQDLGDALFNNRSSKKIDRDPIFFYQFFLSDNKTVDLVPSNFSSREYFQKLNTYAAPRIKDENERSDVLRRAMNLQGKLGSVPSIIRDETINIDLPYIDPNCIANAKKEAGG